MKLRWPLLAAALIVSMLRSHPCRAEPPWRLDGGFTFSRFEQQVKTDLGGAKGERLVEEFQFGYAQALTYRFWRWDRGLSFAAGGFMQVDVGQREAARFAGFDAQGKATTAGDLGGRYVELWMGPLLRVEYWRVFLELGYGLYGARRDDARDDLPAEGGDRSGTLRTSPTVAWSFALGARIPIVTDVDFVLRMQYRIRYYDQRGGEPLAGQAVHGTQNYSPFIGLAWTFGRPSPGGP